MLQRLQIPTIRDPRGNLSVIEGGIGVPFEIRRVYYLHDVPFGAERGGHAHRRLVQAIVPLSGSFNLRTHDGSRWHEDVAADSSEALVIPRMTWREINGFSSGAVCLVIASEHFDESDYIRDFEVFLAEVRPKQSHARD